MQGDAIVEFYQQLGKFAEARLPLPDGLRQIARASRSGRTRDTLDAIASASESGTPLSTALEQHADFATPFHLSLIRAGETSGTLPDLLFAVARHARGRQDILERLRAIIAYPVVTTFTAAATVLVCLSVFLPVLREATRGAFGPNVELPAILRATESLEPLAPALWIIWGVLFALTIFFLLGGRFTRRPLFAILARLPGMGRITHQLDTTRLTGLLATLVRNKLPLTDALQLGSEVVASPKLQAQLQTAAANIREGQHPADALSPASKRTTANNSTTIDPLLPLLFTQTPDDALPDELALLESYYSQRADTTIRRVTTTWNTIMFIIMVIATLGALLLAMLPMVDLIQQLEGFR